MDAFLEIVNAGGKEGLLVGVAVLVIVFGLNKSGVIVTKGQKQTANVVLSVLFAGVGLLDPAFQDVIAASLASLGSALAYEGIRWLINFIKPQ